MTKELNKRKKKVLVTGCAGFIGFHLTKLLCKSDYMVISLDNMNNYYDTRLKDQRLKLLQEEVNFLFVQADIKEKEVLEKIIEDYKIETVVNLAAQAGVRYSLEHPDEYIQNNVLGFFNLLEILKNKSIHLIYASSSSVYGKNKKVPFSEEDKTETPVSLYAATKKTNELMAYTYSHLYGLKTTGLRFFTVYGPFGRPDMAYYSFTEDLVKGKKIKLFNNGHCKRDFTYVDDITAAIEKIIDNPPINNYEIFNIGNSNPENLLDMVNCLFNLLKQYNLINQEIELEEMVEYYPLQPGDVVSTWADTDKLSKAYNYNPSTPLNKGLEEFVKWYVKEREKENNE